MSKSKTVSIVCKYENNQVSIDATNNYNDLSDDYKQTVQNLAGATLSGMDNVLGNAVTFSDHTPINSIYRH